MNNIFCLLTADPACAKETEVLTADFIYIRFHGDKARYSSNYKDKVLKERALKIKQWLDSCKALYAFFNNDAHGYAPKNAVRFRTFIQDAL